MSSSRQRNPICLLSCWRQIPDKGRQYNALMQAVGGWDGHEKMVSVSVRVNIHSQLIHNLK